MKKLMLFIVVISTSLFSGFLFGQEKSEDVEYTVPVYDFNMIEPLFHPEATNDTTYIFNFWATFCIPCIKELPYFEKIGAQYSAKKVKVILVSLDFKSKLESQVLPFLKKRAIRSKVILLSDPDANAWIDKVDGSWSGALPATLIVKGQHREFYERSFDQEELNILTTKFIEK